MTYKTSTLNSFVATEQPTFIGDTQIDGHIDGRPVILRRGVNGMLMPAIGTVVTMPYGSGIVSGYREDRLVVDVVDFNEDFEFETKDIENPDILDASEYVESLNRCYRLSVESIHSDFTRLHKSEEKGVLSEKNLDRMHLSFPLPASNTEIVIAFKGDYLAPTDSIVYKEVSTPKLSPAELARQKRLEIAEAKRLADELLGDDGSIENIPADVLAEMAMEFGEL